LDRNNRKERAMAHRIIFTTTAPVPGGAYSQAIRAGQILATAGQVGLDPITGETPEGVVAQTRIALENLRNVLNAGGAEPRDVIKTMCFLTNIDDFALFNKEYEDFFGDHKPARSTVGVALAGGFVVEVEAIAVVGD
jgi:2-iminobutanoate/2-iminopropanoate deaminase